MSSKKSATSLKTYDRLVALPQSLTWHEWDFRWIGSAEEAYMVARYEYARELIRFVDHGWKPGSSREAARDVKLLLTQLRKLLKNKTLGPLDFGFTFMPPQFDYLVELLDLVVRLNGPVRGGLMPLPAYEIRDKVRSLVAARRAQSGLSIRYKVFGEPEPELDVWQIPTAFEFSVPQYPMMDIERAVAEFRKWAEASHMFDVQEPTKGGRPSLSPLARLSYYRFTQGRKALKLHGQFADLLGANASSSACPEVMSYGQSLYAKDLKRSRRSMAPFWSKSLKDVEGDLRQILDGLVLLLASRPKRARK
jgi:hypothetical protein